MYSARVSGAGEFTVQPPVELLTHPPQLDVHQLHPDGQRFIALESLEPEFAGVEIRVILNWFAVVQGQVAERSGPEGASNAVRSGS